MAAHPEKPGLSRDELVPRAMRDEDLEVVLRNETRAYAYPWTLGMFEDCLGAQPPYDCRVGVRGGSLVAHGILSVGAGEAHLLNVCVSRDLQGRGYGRLMLQHLVQRAVRLGAGTMFLEVRPTNFAALGLYHSFGFREIGVRKDYYPSSLGREDAHVYAMHLEHFSPNP